MIDHAVRARGIGGSEIAAILGLDPRRDAYSVWAEKLGLVRRKPPNERMEAGKFLEQGIAHWYAARTHRQVSWCDETTCHPDREWQVATPDALIGIDGPWAPWAGGLDCKNVAFDQRDKWGESGTDAVPVPIHLQCQWYCDVLDLPWWDVAACLGGNQLDIYRVNRDEDIITAAREEGDRFWHENVLARVAPPAGPSPATTEALSEMYPQHVANIRFASPAEGELLAELKAANEAWEPVNARCVAAENQLKAAIADGEGLIHNHWKVTWKKDPDSTGPDWQKIAQEMALRVALLQQQVGIENYPLEWCETIDRMTAAKEYRRITRRGARKLHANWGRA